MLHAALNFTVPICASSLPQRSPTTCPSSCFDDILSRLLFNVGPVGARLSSSVADLPRNQLLTLQHTLPRPFPTMSTFKSSQEHFSRDLHHSVSVSNSLSEGRREIDYCCSPDQTRLELEERTVGNSSLAGAEGTKVFDDTDEIKHLQSLLESQEPRERSACQTAAGRALWNHVIYDPLAEVLAGESCLKSLKLKMEEDRVNKARETAGVMLAVRTLWFDSKVEAALQCLTTPETEEADCGRQVVLLGAGMDARAYRLRCLEECTVFEVDLPKVVELKSSLLKAMARAGRPIPNLCAKHLVRVAADISSADWFEKLKESGYHPAQNTIWILEGILYYLREAHAMAVLSCISHHCPRDTVVLADFMNESSTQLSYELKTGFYFHSDWPEELLPSLGFSEVQVSQIGDDDANFGLVEDPESFFNRIRKIPRYIKSDADGSPCRRLLLVQSRVA